MRESMRILVLGASGYLGENVYQQFCRIDEDVQVLSIPIQEKD